MLAPYGVYSTDCSFTITKADLDITPIVSSHIVLGDYVFRFLMKVPSSTSSTSSSSTNLNCYVCHVLYQKGPSVKSKILVTARFRIRAKLSDWVSGAYTSEMIPTGAIHVNSCVTRENQEPIMSVSMSIDFRSSDNTAETVKSSDNTAETVKSSDNTDVTV
jgi:hypothetical protein